MLILQNEVGNFSSSFVRFLIKGPKPSLKTYCSIPFLLLDQVELARPTNIRIGLTNLGVITMETRMV